MVIHCTSKKSVDSFTKINPKISKTEESYDGFINRNIYNFLLLLFWIYALDTKCASTKLASQIIQCN